MKEIELAIERLQSDHEASRKKSHIKLNVSDHHFMTLNTKSNSLYSNKVVYSSEDYIDETYHEAEMFFGKEFGWFVNLESTKTVDYLKDKGWIIHDRYEGRYKAVEGHYCDDEHIVEVTPDSPYVKELVEVTMQVWGTVNVTDVNESIRLYNEYLNSEDRRGGYILYMKDQEALGYGSYRRSSCGQYMYLAGTGVLESHRRRGIYKALLSQRLKKASEMGVQYVIAQARKDHSSPILEKLGFHKAGDFALMTRNQAK